MIKSNISNISLQLIIIVPNELLVTSEIAEFLMNLTLSIILPSAFYLTFFYNYNLT